MTPRSRKNSIDKKFRKNSGDSIDSCSKEFFNEKKKFCIPIKKRRLREQPLEIKDPSPVPDKFKYFTDFRTKIEN